MGSTSVPRSGGKVGRGQRRLAVYGWGLEMKRFSTFSAVSRKASDVGSRLRYEI